MRARLLMGVTLALVLVAAAGCLGAPDDEPDARSGAAVNVTNGVPSGVDVFVDRQRGVVCYIYDDNQYEQGGLSCVPTNQTDAGTGGWR